MKFYIVFELVGRLGIPNVVGVFSTLVLAQDAVDRVCKEQHKSKEDFDIQKWFVNTATLRCE